MTITIKKGDKYNNLVIIKEVGKKGNFRVVQCQCKCGNIKDIYLHHITSGHTKTCGCLIFKHNLSRSRIYKIWKGINTRCNNPKIKQYKDYGGKGIRCEWNSFEDFHKDMGKEYKDGLTIDRRKNDRNYCKNNCRWVTMKAQQRNRTNNRIYKGKCISEWIEELGLDYNKTYARIHRGWDMKKVLNTK